MKAKVRNRIALQRYRFDRDFARGNKKRAYAHLRGKDRTGYALSAIFRSRYTDALIPSFASLAASLANQTETAYKVSLRMPGEREVTR